MPRPTLLEARLEDARSSDTPNLLAPLELIKTNGYIPQNINLGIGAVRENAENRSNQSGTKDRTQFWGSAAVQLVVGVAKELAVGLDPYDEPWTDQKLEDRLRAWVVPSMRAFLIYRRDPNDAWRQVEIRGNTPSGPSIGLVRSDFDRVALAWKAPRGISESYVLEETPLASTLDTEAGRAYDLTFNRTYPASSPIGTQPILNRGNAPTFPHRVFIYGPCAQPRIENVTTGETLEFKSTFSLTAGQYLEIDFEEGTVLLDGNPANSRYDRIDFSVSTWWQLVPGTNLCRFYPLSSTPPSIAYIKWRHGYY
jgi:hypothetical protein